MVRNNTPMEKRDMKESPKCWFVYLLTLSPEVNKMSAVQQNIFYYLIYRGYVMYDDAWKEMRRQQILKGGFEVKHYEKEWRCYNDRFFYDAACQNLFTFHTSISEIARAIGYNGNTKMLLEQVKTVVNTNITMPLEKAKGGYKNEVEILGQVFQSEFIKENNHTDIVIKMHYEKVDRLFRNERVNGNKKIRTAFVRFRLWDMCKLSSKYAKIIFRLIVQWQKAKKTPVYYDIKGVLGLPDGVRSGDVMSRYINPACIEIGKILDLDIRAIPTYNRYDNRTIEGIQFKFTKGFYIDNSTDDESNNYYEGDIDEVLPYEPWQYMYN